MYRLDDSIGFLLSRTTRRVTQRLSARFEAYDVTPEQFSVLKRLTEEDGITQKELARRAAKDQTNVTRILDQLTRKGLVERKANADDRRSSLVRITEDGLRVCETLSPVEREVMNETLRGFDREEVAVLKAMLSRIERNAADGEAKS